MTPSLTDFPMHRIKTMLSLALLNFAIFSVQADTVKTGPSLLGAAHQAMKPNKYTGIDSMLVYQQGKLLSEYYYGKFSANTTHRTHSTFKSINALIALIAIEQGLLSEQESLFPLLNSLSKQQSKDPQKSRIRIKDLLNMTSGIACDESPGSEGPNHEWALDEGPKPLQYSMEIKMAAEPGSQWHYCNANSFMLAGAVSAALIRAGKEDIFSFADKYLMAPLGIKHYRLNRSPNGQYLMGQGNAHFLPADLAKFGLLILNKGKWMNKRIISEQTIKKLYGSKHKINWSFTDTINPRQDSKTTYSHQWYQTPFDIKGSRVWALHSWGNGGQFIFVVPKLSAVIVFTGSNQGNFDKQKQPFDVMQQYVLPELMKISRHTEISEQLPAVNKTMPTKQLSSTKASDAL